MSRGGGTIGEQIAPTNQEFAGVHRMGFGPLFGLYHVVTVRQIANNTTFMTFFDNTSIYDFLILQIIAHRPVDGNDVGTDHSSGVWRVFHSGPGVDLLNAAALLDLTEIRAAMSWFPTTFDAPTGLRDIVRAGEILSCMMSDVSTNPGSFSATVIGVFLPVP